MTRALSLALQALVGLMALAIATILVGPRLAGWDVVTVLSGSMAPTYPVDSVLAVESVDPAKIEEGDVIAFKPEDDRPMVTHRVIAVTETPAGRSFTTKGDANEDPDRTPVPASAVHGRVVFGVPVLGKLIKAAHTPLGFLGLLVLPALAVILHEVRSIVRTLREDRAERSIQDDGDDAATEPPGEPVEPVEPTVIHAPRHLSPAPFVEPGPVDPIVAAAPPAFEPAALDRLALAPAALPTDEPSRQLVIVTVSASLATRREIIDLAELSGGAVVAVGRGAIAVALAADPPAVAAFERLLQPFGVLSVQRSGILTVSLPDDVVETSAAALASEFDRIVAEALAAPVAREGFAP